MNLWANFYTFVTISMSVPATSEGQSPGRGLVGPVGLGQGGGASLRLMPRFLPDYGRGSDPSKICSGTSESGTPPSAVTSHVSCM